MRLKQLEDALQGASDIIAEWVNENEFARKRIRRLFERMPLLYQN